MIDVKIIAGRPVLEVTDSDVFRQLVELVDRSYRIHLRAGNPPLPVAEEFTEKAMAAARLLMSVHGQLHANGDHEPASFTTTTNVARALRVSVRTISRRAARDEIPGAKRHGHAWLIPIAYLTQENNR